MIEQKLLLPYMVGGLLYTPATRSGIVRKIKERQYSCLTSVAFCLEDSIRDESLKQAERTLKETLTALGELRELPLLFVRVRSPQHLRHVHQLLADTERILTGYILPKFDLSNAEDYAVLIRELPKSGGGRLYYMPILESRMVADIGTRTVCLLKLRQLCDGMKEQILNIRVGGADLCNLYGLRREETQSIYEAGAVRDILADIINVFAPEYVVSGAVWEYFGTDPQASWAAGLQREIALDRLNGFIGKTAIHPAQLPFIYRGLQVRRRDYADAMKILQWDNEELGAAKGEGRMNELKCHTQWAVRTASLAEIYGIRED